MQLISSLTAPLALALLASRVSSMGINCEGDSSCAIFYPSNGLVLVNQLVSYLNSTSPSKVYMNNEHIVCIPGTATLRKSSTLGNICIYPQNTNGGITVAQTLPLLQQLMNHPCTTCGSIPTQPGNDVKTGEVTANWSLHPNGCIGVC